MPLPGGLLRIHQHPLLAAKEILEPISSVTDIIPIIENHHENWDGSGYPRNLSGQEIPLLSQIILLVDAYTAMTHERAYRPALSEDKALESIQQDSGRKWKKPRYPTNNPFSSNRYVSFSE